MTRARKPITKTITDFSDADGAVESPPLAPHDSFTGETLSADFKDDVGPDHGVADDMTDEQFIIACNSVEPSKLDSAFALALICARKHSFVDARETMRRAKLNKTKFSQLRSIANDRRLEQIRNSLPPSAGYSVIYRISQMTDDQFELAKKKGLFSSTFSRSAIIDFIGNDGAAAKPPSKTRFATILLAPGIAETSKSELRSLIERIKAISDVTVKLTAI